MTLDATCAAPRPRHLCARRGAQQVVAGASSRFREPGLREYLLGRRSFGQLVRAAERADVHEVCYLAFGRGKRILTLQRVPNRAVDTVMHHVFGVEDFDKACRRARPRGLRFIGYLHTHILSDAVPSAGDLRGYRPGSLLLIYSTTTGALRSFRVRSRRSFDEIPIRIVSAIQPGPSRGRRGASAWIRE